MGEDSIPIQGTRGGQTNLTRNPAWWNG